MTDPKEITPEPQEIEEAKRNPNGWIYRVSGQYRASDRVPPEAIAGAWKVDKDGIIIGDFIVNPNFRS